MAIDDNTSYELTGAQVKDLASKINAKADASSVPAAQVNSDWNANSGVAEILNKPTIPTVNDGTLTIQHNGTTKGTFTANQSTASTVNIETIYADDYISTTALTPIVSTGMIEDEAVTTAKIDDGAVTNAKIDWSTFLVKRNLTLTTDSTGNIATDIPIATYDVISCRCTNPNNSRNVFITPYAWSTGYWQIHVQNVAGNSAYQGSLNVDFLLIDKTKTGVN